VREGQREPSLASRLRAKLNRTSDRLMASTYGVQARLNEDGSSFSGGERDHLFLSDGGRAFLDASAVAGIDSPADGRSFVTWDPDRDGWIDLAVQNVNTPRLELFRNSIGDREPVGANGRGMVAFRFVGGARAKEPGVPGEPRSPRDGYGARLRVDLGDMTLQREHAAGAGLAAQNSSTLMVGIGARAVAKSVSVRWPSGRVQTIENVPEGTLVTVHEYPAAGTAAFVQEPYRRQRAPVPPRPPRTWRTLTLARDGGTHPPLRLYTTFASWCAACRKETPDLETLRRAFRRDELELYAIPIDPEDPPDRVAAWMKEVNPPYTLVAGLSPAAMAEVKALVIDELKQDAVPATLLVDPEGRLLASQWGPPSVSRIRELLAAQRPATVPSPPVRQALAR
jgi:hypothetical protein